MISLSKPGGLSLEFVGFLQAAGLVLYCGLVGSLLANGNRLFGPAPIFLAPVLFLLLFVLSAVISASIFLGYPFFIFWEEKRTAKALRLIFYSTAWLGFFVILFLSLFVLPNRIGL